MIGISINGNVIKVTKNEIKDAQRIRGELDTGELEMAQRTVDIWMRSAPDAKATERRKAVARAFGLSDEIKFL